MCCNGFLLLVGVYVRRHTPRGYTDCWFLSRGQNEKTPRSLIFVEANRAERGGSSWIHRSGGAGVWGGLAAGAGVITKMVKGHEGTKTRPAQSGVRGASARSGGAGGRPPAGRGFGGGTPPAGRRPNQSPPQATTRRLLFLSAAKSAVFPVLFVLFVLFLARAGPEHHSRRGMVRDGSTSGGSGGGLHPQIGAWGVPSLRGSGGC